MIQNKGTLATYFETGDRPTQQQFSDLIQSTIGVIGKLSGADFNSLADQQITISGGTKFVPTGYVIVNPTDVSSSKDGQFWTGVGRTGTKMAQTTFNMGTDSDLSLLTDSDKYTNVGSTSANDTLGTVLYFSLGTAQGVAATADILIFGYAVN